MTVFLVPVGAGRHALYCEVQEAEAERTEPAEPEPSGSFRQRLLHRCWRPVAAFRQRMLHRFRRSVADAEAEREREELGEAPPGRRGLARFVVRKIAEAVAEQRLLWHLGRTDASCLMHPDALPGAEALRLARTEFAADYRKHLRRAIVNGLLSVVLGVVFFFVPGPNLIAYYFLFLAIGHYFALRGALRGLRGVAWSTAPSKALSDVHAALALEPPARRSELERITGELGLARLWRFVERVAPRPA